MNRFLPIGSVIVLKKSNESIMIVGYGVRVEKEKTTYDYAGCYMPVGCTDPKSAVYFNQTDIKTILFIGYQSHQSIMVQNKLAEINNIEVLNSTLQQLLPIGSVVKLKRGIKKLMIFSYIGVVGKKITDYVGCEYPGGFNNDTKYYFNEDDIDIIYYIGPQNKEAYNYKTIINDCLIQYKQGTDLLEILANIEEKYTGKDASEFRKLIPEIRDYLNNKNVNPTVAIYKDKEGEKK